LHALDALIKAAQDSVGKVIDSHYDRMKKLGAPTDGTTLLSDVGE